MAALMGAMTCLGECHDMPRWVPCLALVSAMAYLGGCHGMPKRVIPAQNFFLPVPFAQNVFVISLYDIWKVSQASNPRFASVPRWVPWHALVGAVVGAKTSHARTNFFFARAICPKCVSNIII